MRVRGDESTGGASLSRDTGRCLEPSCAITGKGGCTQRLIAEEVRTPVIVILEMDGDPDALLAATAELEARRPTSAVTARAVAPMEGGVIPYTVWESAATRDAYLSRSTKRHFRRADSWPPSPACARAFSRTPNCPFGEN